MGAIRYTIDEKLLHFFAQQLPLEVFVETGTYQGENLKVAQKFFKACFSVELDGNHFRKVSKQFSGNENIFIEQGDSKELLASIKDQVTQASAVFWLDAHDVYNKVNAEIDPLNAQSPLLGELEAIEVLNTSSVILIDDAHLYLSVPPKPNAFGRWPDFHDVTLALLKMSSQHRIAIYNDTIVYYPHQLRAAYSQFSYEHSIDILDVILDARRYRESKG